MDSLRSFGGLILLLIAIAMQVLSVDYCDLESCTLPHIGCNNTAEFGDACQDASVVTVNVSLILHLHNSKRHQVALGSQRLKAALRMTTMQWDDELAHLALLSVKTCSSNQTFCLATSTHRHPGQNAALVGYYGQASKYADDVMVVRCISLWAEEERHVHIKDINKFPNNNPNNEVFGHFTLMVNEKNTHVGCAAIRFTWDLSTMFYFACNYATTNIMGSPVFLAGERTAVLCMTGKNPEYRNLCSIREYDYTTLRDLYRANGRIRGDGTKEEKVVLS